MPDVSRASLAAALATLLPGGEAFPSAAEVGLAEVVATVPCPSTVESIARLLERLDERAGRGGLAGAAPKRRLRLMHEAEAGDEAFPVLLRTAYLCYYAQPSVVELLRLEGHDVNDAPQPRGYAMEPFDQSLLPASPRGSFVPTDAVRRRTRQGGA